MQIVTSILTRNMAPMLALCCCYTDVNVVLYWHNMATSLFEVLHVIVMLNCAVLVVVVFCVRD